MLVVYRGGRVRRNSKDNGLSQELVSWDEGRVLLDVYYLINIRLKLIVYLEAIGRYNLRSSAVIRKG